MAGMKQSLMNLTGRKYGKLTVICRSQNVYPKKTKTWLCICDCGGEKIVLQTYLTKRKNRIKSCGCIGVEQRRTVSISNSKKLQKYTPKEQSIMYIFNTNCGDYSDGDLSVRDFYRLTQNNCSYCGKAPQVTYNQAKADIKVSRHRSQEAVDSGDFTYNGLDRINSNLPHDFTNCITSCRSCNMFKRDRSIDDFLDQIFKCYSNLDEIKNVKPFSRRVKNLLGKTFGNLVVIAKGKVDFTWECICSCSESGSICDGQVLVFKEEQLTSGNVTSCVEFPGVGNKYLKKMIGLRRMFVSSKSKGRYYSNGDLTINDAEILMQLDCYYCGSPPINRFNAHRRLVSPASAFARDNGLLLYNGIDRIDSTTKAHNKDNVVTACRFCNWAKLNKSIVEFADRIEKIYNHCQNTLNQRLDGESTTDLFKRINEPKLSEEDVAGMYPNGLHKKRPGVNKRKSQKKD